jgi:urease accessory protein
MPYFVPRILPLAAVVLLASVPAQAHHPMGGATPSTFAEGLLSGIGHPIIDVDHLAFLIVVALLAFAIAGRARYWVPLAFVGATALGAGAHLGAGSLPLAEAMIATSVLAGGLAVVLGWLPSALLLAGMLGLFGLFHGYAYGEAIVGAEATPILAYLLGFGLIQYAVIAAIVRGLEVVEGRSAPLRARLSAWTGGAAVALGVASLSAAIA